MSKNTTTKIAVTGAAGRMGKTLIQAISEAPDLSLGAAIERPGLSVVGADAGDLAGTGSLGVALTDSLERVCDQFDVLIDFTVAEATQVNMEICHRARKKMVIGTTGFNEEQLKRLHSISEDIAVVMAPNFSVGVNATLKLIEIAAGILGEQTDIEITESHHRHKVDAPSGTAMKMGEVIARKLGRDLSEVAVYGRKGLTGVRNPKAIGFQSIRAGDIVGDHTVTFAGLGERLEITHRAQSRLNFAEGAIRAASWISTHPYGLFDMQDVLQLKDIS